MAKNKKIVINMVLILGWLFTTIQSQDLVFAQTPVPPTPQPLFLPTVQSVRPDTSNLDCPDGDPVGYGVKTPSPLWLQLCGQCLGGWGFEPTRQAPTPTPAPVTNTELRALSDFWKYLGEGDYIRNFTPLNVYVGKFLLNTYTIPNLYGYQLSANGSYWAGIDMDWQIKYYGRPYPYCSGTYNYQLRITNQPSIPENELIVHFPDGEHEDIIIPGDISYPQYGYYQFPGDFYTNEDREHSLKIKIEIYVSDSGDINPPEYYVDINKYGCPTANQDVEATFNWRQSKFPEEPGSGGYCDSIKAEGESGSFEDVFGFGYTGFVWGESYCADIGPYDFNFLGLEFSIPYIAHLCVQEIFLGEVNMLGATVSLDLFAVILAIAWILRNLFIS